LRANKLNFFQGWLLRDGWFANDLANLNKHQIEIRKYFEPLKKYQKNIDNLISKIRVNTDLLIGVHIRQGDYLQHQDGRYFYSTEVYVKIMESVLRLFPQQKVKFLICSNQKQENESFQHLSFVYGNNHLIEDMYSLAECDYIIGPPSSYTMWASFYGDRPLYMIRDIDKTLIMEDFVKFYQWQGIFYPNDDWSQTFWKWTH